MHYYKVAPLLLCVGPLHDPCMTHEWTLHMSVESKRVAKLQSLRGTLMMMTMMTTTNQNACFDHHEDYYYNEVVSRHCSVEDDIGSHRWGGVARA